MDPDRSDGEAAETVTLRVRRTHLAAIAGLVVGLAAGIAVGALIAGGDDPQYTLAAPVSGLPASSDPSAPAGAASSEPVDIGTEGRPATGPEDADATVVEFVDFQCPFCRRYHLETYPRLQQEYGGRVNFVSRHFPLGIHPLAEPAAKAAECAFEEGSFAVYQDLLFRDQEGLTEADLPKLATEAGLDRAEFTACLGDPDTAAAVEDDIADGRAAGVTGTPTFFVDGQRLVGAAPLEKFEAAIDTALAD